MPKSLFGAALVALFALLGDCLAIDEPARGLRGIRLQEVNRSTRAPGAGLHGPRTLEGPFSIAPQTESVRPSHSLGAGRLNSFISNFITTKHIASLSGAMTKNGSVIWKNAFGYAKVSDQTLAKKSTLYMLASVTKTVTATALMQLYDEGLFELHDPVNDYLPFSLIHPQHPNTEITFFMLLTHTSSIEDNWSAMPYYPGDSPIPLGDYLEDYLTPGGAYYDPAKNFYAFEPGTQFKYGNIATSLAGYMVEVLSGLSLEDYCQANLFPLLDMHETSYFLAGLDEDHIAMPTYWNGSQYKEFGHFGYSDYPDGQLRTSSLQLLNLLTSYMQGGVFKGNRVLESSTVDLMLSPQIPSIDPTQGIIWYKWTFNGRELWGHNGGDQGVTTDMYYWPAENTGVVILTNGEAGYAQVLEQLLVYSEIW